MVARAVPEDWADPVGVVVAVAEAELLAGAEVDAQMTVVGRVVTLLAAQNYVKTLVSSPRNVARSGIMFTAEAKLIAEFWSASSHLSARQHEMPLMKICEPQMQAGSRPQSPMPSRR